MLGFYGRILTVNLTEESFEIEALPKKSVNKYLEGRGWLTHLLLTKNRPGVDPLSAENHLIFATGPFCQSNLWAAAVTGVHQVPADRGSTPSPIRAGKSRRLSMLQVSTPW